VASVVAALQTTQQQQQQRPPMSDEFLMHVYKVAMCPNAAHRHSWVSFSTRAMLSSPARATQPQPAADKSSLKTPQTQKSCPYAHAGVRFHPGDWQIYQFAVATTKSTNTHPRYPRPTPPPPPPNLQTTTGARAPAPFKPCVVLVRVVPADSARRPVPRRRRVPLRAPRV
jgi:hypothetical protein